MASTYSTNLKIELIGTGDQSGTWGTTTNTNLGSLIEEAIAGYVTQAVTDGAATVLTIPNGTSSNGRNYVIELTGALTANRTVEVPAVDKPYIFFNNTSGGYSVTVKVTGQTGVTIANGKKAIVYTNSTDVIEVVNAPVSEAGTQTLTNKTLTNPTINGFTGSTAVINVGSGQFYKDTSGNVGIGTSSPNAKLEVNSSTAGSEVSRFEGAYSASGTVNLTNWRRSGGAVAAVMRYNDANNDMEFGTTSAHAQAFLTSGSERMRIDSSGNVMIGRTSASGKLDVEGAAIIRGFLTATDAIKLGGNTSAPSTDSFIYRPADNTLAFGTANSERMRIDSSGNVGIGTSSVLTKFQVSKASLASFTGTSIGTMLVADSGNTGNYFTTIDFNTSANGSIPLARIGMQYTGSGSYLCFGTSNNYANGITNTGMFLDYVANLTVAGNVTAYSDARLKKNVSTIDKALDLVEKMRGVRYERIDSGKAGVGVIAQEMQEVLPEVVHEGENLSVAYGNIVGVLIEAVKELSARVKELEAK